MALENVSEKVNKLVVGLGIIFLILAIVVPVYSPKFKLLFGIFFSVISTVFLLFSRKLVKVFSKKFVDPVVITDSFSAVLLDEDGNIKETRNQ